MSRPFKKLYYRVKILRKNYLVVILLAILAFVLVGATFLSVNFIQKASSEDSSKIVNGDFEGGVHNATFTTEGVCPDYVHELSMANVEGNSASISKDTKVLGVSRVNLGAVEDTFVDRWNPDVNAGNITEVAVRPGIKRPLIKFDLIQLNGKVIRSAKLKLHVNARSNENSIWFKVKGVEGDWNERSVTWNTRPQMGDKTYAQSPMISSINGDVTIDVTDLIQDLVNGTIKNNGMYIDSFSSSNVQYNFYSKEHSSTIDISPVLEVEYEVVHDASQNEKNSTPDLSDNVENIPAGGIIPNDSDDMDVKTYKLPEPVRKDTINTSGLMVDRSDIDDAQRWIDRNPGVHIILMNVSWAQTDGDWGRIKNQLNKLRPENKVIIRLMSSGYSDFSKLPNGQQYDAYVPQRIASNPSNMIYVNDDAKCSAWRLNYLSPSTISEMKKWTRSFAKEFKNDDRVIGVVYGPGSAGEAKPWMTTQYGGCSTDAWRDAFMNSSYKYKETKDPRYVYDYIVPVVSEIGEEWKDVSKDISVQTSSGYVFPFMGEAWRKYLAKYRVGIQESGLYPIQTGCLKAFDKRYNRIYMQLQYPKYTPADFDVHMHTMWLEAEALGWGYPSNREYHHFYEPYVSSRALFEWTFRNSVARRNRRIMLWMSNDPNDPVTGSWYKIPQDIIAFGNKYLGIPPKDNDTIWITFKGRPVNDNFYCFDYFNYTYGMKTDLELANRWSPKNSDDLTAWSKDKEFRDLTKSTGEGKNDWRYYSARYIDKNILIDVDDEWVKKLNGKKVLLKMTWLDNDNGTFDIVYAGESGSTKLVTVKKHNTKKWVSGSWIIENPVFNGAIGDSNSNLPDYLKPRWPNGFDIMLKDNSDGRDVISELILTTAGTGVQTFDVGDSAGFETNDTKTEVEKSQVCTVGTVGNKWRRVGPVTVPQGFLVTSVKSATGKKSQKIHAEGAEVGIKYDSDLLLDSNTYSISADVFVERGKLRVFIKDATDDSVVVVQDVSKSENWDNINLVFKAHSGRKYNLYFLSDSNASNDFYIDNVTLMKNVTNDNETDEITGFSGTEISSLEMNVENKYVSAFSRALLGQNLTPKASSVLNENDESLYIAPLKDLKVPLYRYSDKSYVYIPNPDINEWSFASGSDDYIKKYDGSSVEFVRSGRIFQYIDAKKFKKGAKYKVSVVYSVIGDHAMVNNKMRLRGTVVYKDQLRFYIGSTMLFDENVQNVDNTSNHKTKSIYFTYNPLLNKDAGVVRIVIGLTDRNDDNTKLIVDKFSIREVDNNGNSVGQELVDDSDFNRVVFKDGRFPLTSGLLDKYLSLAKSINGDFIFSVQPGATIEPSSCKSGHCNTNADAIRNDVINNPDFDEMIRELFDIIDYSKEVGKPIKYVEFGSEPEIWWTNYDNSYNYGIGHDRVYARYKLYGEMYALFAKRFKQRYSDVELGAYIGYGDSWKYSLNGFWDGFNKVDNGNIAKPDFWTPHSYPLRAWGDGLCRVNDSVDKKACVDNSLANYGKDVYCDRSVNEIVTSDERGKEIVIGNVNVNLSDNVKSKIEKDIESYKFLDAFYECSTQYLNNKGLSNVKYIPTEWETSGSTSVAWGTVSDELFTADMLSRYAKLGVYGATHFSTWGGDSIISGYGNVSPPYLTFKLYDKYISRAPYMLETNNDKEETVSTYAYTDKKNAVYFVIVNRHIRDGYSSVKLNLPGGLNLDKSNVQEYVVGCYEESRGSSCIYDADRSALNGVLVDYRNADNVLNTVAPKTVDLSNDTIKVKNHSWYLLKYTIDNNPPPGNICFSDNSIKFDNINVIQSINPAPSVKVTVSIKTGSDISDGARLKLSRIYVSDGITVEKTIVNNVAVAKNTDYNFADVYNYKDERNTTDEFPLNSKFKYKVVISDDGCSDEATDVINDLNLFDPQGMVVAKNDICTVKGWVRDQDKPAEGVGINIAIDDPSNRIKDMVADDYRSDLEVQFGGKKFAYHGFSVNLDNYINDEVEHKVYIVAKNIEGTGGNDTEIWNSPVAIRCLKPESPRTKKIVMSAKKENFGDVDRLPRISVYNGDTKYTSVYIDKDDFNDYVVEVPVGTDIKDLDFVYDNDDSSEESGLDVNLVIKSIKDNDTNVVYDNLSASYCKYNFFDENFDLHMYCGGDIRVVGDDTQNSRIEYVIARSQVSGIAKSKRAKLSIMLNDRLIGTAFVEDLSNHKYPFRVPLLDGFYPYGDIVFRFDNDFYSSDPSGDLNLVLVSSTNNEKRCDRFILDNTCNKSSDVETYMYCKGNAKVDLNSCVN